VLLPDLLTFLSSPLFTDSSASHAVFANVVLTMVADYIGGASQLYIATFDADDHDAPRKLYHWLVVMIVMMDRIRGVITKHVMGLWRNIVSMTDDIHASGRDAYRLMQLADDFKVRCLTFINEAKQATRENKEAKEVVVQGVAYGAPDFWNMSLLPSLEELKASNPTLAPVLINAAYRDATHLLRTQVHLMREDVVRSLREGIYSFLNPNAAIKHQKSVAVFNNVAITRMVVDTKEGIVMRVTFDTPRKGFNWGNQHTNTNA
jgi:hypothetical protein